MKISINLLPPEIKAEELKRTRFYLIQTIGVVIVMIMIFLTSLTVALRVLQNKDIAGYKLQLEAAEQKVGDMKNTQASLLLLKDRLAVIDEYFGISSKQSSIYTLVDKLIPVSAVVTTVSVEQAGDVSLAVLVSDAEIMEQLIDNLTSEESNEGMIQRVSVDSLNRGRDNFYRIALKIKAQ